MDFNEYLKDFESKIVVGGFTSGIFSAKEHVVPLRPGKLSNSEFGQFVGEVFEADDIFAINYYGLYKLSEKIITVSNDAMNIFGTIRSIKCPVVYFNSIKFETVKKLSPELYENFAEFKKYVVDLRWGK